MRIISGIFKGRKFNPPKNLPVRPTTDFAKEGLFNVLRTRIDLEDAHILDLFSGTGNMSLEFVSRGAAFVCAIDENRNCISFLQKVCTELAITEIIGKKAEALNYLKREEKVYDLIFADPPYIYKMGTNLVDSIFERNLLKDEGYFILEHGKDQKFEEHPLFQFSKKFGNVNFTFFAKSSE